MVPNKRALGQRPNGSFNKSGLPRLVEGGGAAGPVTGTCLPGGGGWSRGALPQRSVAHVRPGGGAGDEQTGSVGKRVPDRGWDPGGHWKEGGLALGRGVTGGLSRVTGGAWCQRRRLRETGKDDAFVLEMLCLLRLPDNQ